MFSKSKGEQNLVDTLIGTTASIKGDIISEGNIRIDGGFNGNIDTKRGVLIGEQASMIGNITAKNIIIYGKLNGNVKCEGVLEIMPSGKLYGDIEVESISIKEGAVFIGKSIMGDKKERTDNLEAIID